jgi:serine/threonine-protein kinase 24/25/MST4
MLFIQVHPIDTADRP